MKDSDGNTRILDAIQSDGFEKVDNSYTKSITVPSSFMERVDQDDDISIYSEEECDCDISCSSHSDLDFNASGHRGLENRGSAFRIAESNSALINLNERKYHQVTDADVDAFELFSLPLDTLHTIATFLKMDDWREFSLISQGASKIYKQIVNRIKMHGFKCAAEVAIAWSIGEHADAKELAGVYISSGVPIYPAPLGHSYHTVNWRMKLEADAISHSTDDSYGTPYANSLDDFYRQRNNSPFMALTYLEEKGMYWKSKKTGIRTQLTVNEINCLKQRFSSRSPETTIAHFFEDSAPVELIDNNIRVGRDDDDLPSIDSRDGTLSNISSPASASSPALESNYKGEKVTLYCHRHLIDRHQQQKPSVYDEEGSLTPSPISLSTDFFHPILLKRSLVPENSKLRFSPISFISYHNMSDSSAANVNARPISRRSHRGVAFTIEDRDEFQLCSVCEKSFHIFEHSVISDLDVRAYDSRSQEDFVHLRSSDSKFCSYSVKDAQRLVSRYEKKLNTLSNTSDYKRFDECLLDFWDEFFKTTANVHFYDKKCPVVRMSKLNLFLSKPFPKAWGTMECEIQRVRKSYRMKGVLGRYHSVYEYRLFVKDRRRHDNEDEDHSSGNIYTLRNDTLLMTSKYRGKHYHDFSASSDQGKHSFNQYYLYAPQQSDVEEHFANVNSPHEVQDSKYYHLQDVTSLDSTQELCRIRTNHFGTEFQISVPFREQSFTAIPQCREKNDAKAIDSGSEAEAEYRSTNLFRSLLGSVRRHSLTTKNKKKTPGSYFSKSIYPSHYPDEDQNFFSTRMERDIGAITYTANVLGNRPRVMNVCLPKLENESMISVSSPCFWLRNPSEECNMLNIFKRIQQNPWYHQHEEAEALEFSHQYNLTLLQNRPPWWNHELNAFVLNFGGRVSVASVKNFQLCDRHDHRNIILQFGRIEGKHSFTCDFSYPLSPIQAFGISISSLQSRFSFSK